MSNNQIVNFVSAISNSQNSLKYSFFWPYSNIILDVLKILKKEGYISYFQICQKRKNKSFKIYLKQEISFGKSNKFKLISKPSLEKHFSKKDLWKFSNNMGMLVLSTPFGILSDREAKLLGTGGKVLLYVS
jgi:small subunit ribosomal protein S8